MQHTSQSFRQFPSRFSSQKGLACRPRTSSCNATTIQFAPPPQCRILMAAKASRRSASLRVCQIPPQRSSDSKRWSWSRKISRYSRVASWSCGRGSSKLSAKTSPPPPLAVDGLLKKVLPIRQWLVLKNELFIIFFIEFTSPCAFDYNHTT